MTRKFDGDALIIATHNAGKMMEFAALLSPFGIKVTSAADHHLDEPEETEDSFVGNARIKARAAVAATGLPALADDSGIEIDGLDGAPGVYTADWAETPNGRDFVQAMTRAWKELKDRGTEEPWTARYPRPDLARRSRSCRRRPPSRSRDLADARCRRPWV